MADRKITGVPWLATRSITAKPSRPGSITSSSTRSKPPAKMRSTAFSPSEQISLV